MERGLVLVTHKRLGHAILEQLKEKSKTAQSDQGGVTLKLVQYLCPRFRASRVTP